MHLEAVSGKAIRTIRISLLLGIGLLCFGIYQQNELTDTSRMLPLGKVILNRSYIGRNESIYNIMDMKPLQFDESYKNPCWKGTKRNGPLADGHIHCLPYFYIIGVKKSGTSDLHARLQHPDICFPAFKESQWMSRLRFGDTAQSLRFSSVHKIFAKGIDVRSVTFYISMFDVPAHKITLNTTQSKKNKEKIYHNMVTGDASPSNLHMHTNWEILPGNEHLKEPKYTTFHYIKHLTPNAKIVIVFRDPVSRLFSDFLHTRGRATAGNTSVLFHRRAVRLMNTYTNCFQKFSMRRCVYNNSMRTEMKKDGVKLAESFHAGFYAFHMRELQAVFREDQLLPLHFSDYTNNMTATLQTVFSFLELKPLSQTEMERNLNLNIKNIGHQIKRGGMLNETERLLKLFYKPYNEDMANLMDEPKYLFKDK